MEVHFPDKAENIPEIISLILALEPETLSLVGEWKDIEFLVPLTNLQELSLENSEVNNLTPLRGLPNLLVLQLKDTKVKDLSPLKEIPNLRLLYLDKANGINLTPLKDTSIDVIFK
jgi:Leucine-rich repeat (LRR) protein